MLEEVCGSFLYRASQILTRKLYEGLAGDEWSWHTILYIVVPGHFTHVENTIDGMHKIITTTECPFPIICQIPITLWLHMEWHWLGHIQQRTPHATKEIIPRVIQPMSSMGEKSEDTVSFLTQRQPNNKPIVTVNIMKYWLSCRESHKQDETPWLNMIPESSLGLPLPLEGEQGTSFSNQYRS